MRLAQVHRIFDLEIRDSIVDSQKHIHGSYHTTTLVSQFGVNYDQCLDDTENCQLDIKNVNRRVRSHWMVRNKMKRL